MTQTIVALADQILDEIEQLRPSCESRELRVQELQTVVHSFGTRLEQVDRNGAAFRIFDRMRQEQPTWWLDHGNYVDAGDCKHLDKWQRIAEAILERVDPDHSLRKRRAGTAAVSTPQLALTSGVVERAIADAESLLSMQGATSAVDRIHTALHGYLRAVASAASIQTAPDASLTEVFKALREKHPKLQPIGARAADIQQVMRALSSVVAVLNPVRNQASVAHPNLQLLDEPEAMLVVNAARSILHYIDAKMH